MKVNVELEAPRRRVRRIVFRKLGRHRVDGSQVWGLADPISGVIEIDSRCKGRKLLETAVHETQHVMFPNMHEDDVAVSAAEISRVVWKLMFRRIDNDKSQPLQDEG